MNANRSAIILTIPEWARYWYRLGYWLGRKIWRTKLCPYEMTRLVYAGSSATVLGAYCLLMELKRLCKLPFSTMLSYLIYSWPCVPRIIVYLPLSIKLFKFANKFSSLHSRVEFCRSCGIELQRNRKCSSGSSEPNSVILIPPEQALQRTIVCK